MKKVKLLALATAVVTALLLYLFLNSLTEAANGKKATVLTAISDIAANTPLTAELVKAVSVPAEAVVPRAMSDLNSVLGRVSQEKIYAGEQILSSMLVTAGDSSNKSLAYTIEPGKRAISISVNNISGVGFMVSPGNRVDLIVYFPPSASNGNTSTAKELMENIPVLAVDNVITKDGKTKNDSSSYSCLTLQVTPDQALKLTMAQAEGEIRAVLRSPLDNAPGSQQKVTLGSILN